MSVYFDKNGLPIPMEHFAKLFDDMEYRRIAQTIVGQYTVSTVWLGVNHNFSASGMPPLIFETMVFETATDTAALDIQERYATESEAREGHRAVVSELKARGVQ